MLDIFFLYFLCKQIGRLAVTKGLQPRIWKIFTISTWIGFEIIGFFVGIILFGFNKNDIFWLMVFVFFCGFGGYLFVRALLEKRPGINKE